MCEIIDKYAAETSFETVVQLIRAGATTIEQVSKVLGIPAEKFEEALKAESFAPKN